MVRKVGMRINVSVVPGASKDKCEKVSEGEYKVWVRQVPEKGKANEAVLKILAEYLGLRPGQLKLISGMTSRHKVVELP